MVATFEAHDSGLCATDAGTRWRFASDLLNLTLGRPGGEPPRQVGERRRGVAAAAEPVLVRGRVVAVKRRYRLTVDAREARVLEGVLSRYASTAMVVADGREEAPASSSKAPAAGVADALRRWDTNGNGRITCREARAHGIALVRRGHPAYRFMRDGDGDGVVCE